MTSTSRTWIALGLLATSLSSFAHSKLLAAVPADGSTVATAPGEVKLRFNEAVEASVTAFELVAPDGKATPLGKAQADPANAATVAAPLPPSLASGAYRVRWSTMGHDGHRVKGEIGFTVK